jgi:hypothetical protein
VVGADRVELGQPGLPDFIPGKGGAVKKIFELLLCIIHPVAVILIWISLLGRSDLGLIGKLTWGIASLVPFVPFVYVLTGNDFL